MNRCEVTYSLFLFQAQDLEGEESIIVFGLQFVAPLQCSLSLSSVSLSRTLLSHSKPNRHSLPPCSHHPYTLYTPFLQAPICQMLNVPWEFQQCTRLHTGSPDVINALTVMCFFTHTQSDPGSPAGSLLSLQGISKQATERKGQWPSI